ncbi:hypothetical protein [Nostoc sp. ATCC 53789]|uniref:hypothetical protein n=1 Tax=Nostoc sp. ATCC 53789 TaxID=76335 RepID=UPI000DEC57AB|nr:hypothetical protein [Nostoc sp. ATCC 53789]QHG21256.1 hypothetical protein GJB62_36025 [Nostoc sp. ATCC 53789]RCJ16647.1 hypothetical protein A6V25_30605 [Nostoc sp. ATCC 53789]
MANQPNSLRYDPRTLSQAYFELAKRWMIAAILSKILVFLFGTLTIFLPIIPGYAPFIITIISITSDLFAWRSDMIKGTSEALLRKLDYWKSFGWAMSKAEMSDLLMRSPTNLYRLAPNEMLGEEYFASREGIGAKRAIENIQESAWWSKHLSERMGQYCFAATCILIAVLFGVLVLSVQTIAGSNTLTNIGRVVTSSLMLVFSLGLFRFVVGYYGFSRKAGQIEEKIENLIKLQTFDDIEAIKVVQEYHIARASAPLIPSWVWKQMRNDLNEMWEKYRQ